MIIPFVIPLTWYFRRWLEERLRALCDVERIFIAALKLNRHTLNRKTQIKSIYSGLQSRIKDFSCIFLSSISFWAQNRQKFTRKFPFLYRNIRNNPKHAWNSVYNFPYSFYRMANGRTVRLQWWRRKTSWGCHTWNAGPVEVVVVCAWAICKVNGNFTLLSLFLQYFFDFDSPSFDIVNNCDIPISASLFMIFTNGKDLIGSLPETVLLS